MKRNILLAILAAASLAGFAKTDNAKKPNVLDLKTSITDQAIVYPESYEADTQKLLESWFVKNYTATDKRYETEPDADVSDDEMVKRLSALPTVIEMPYNQVVRSYIDRYTKNGRAQIAAILGLSLYYMPIFEQALEEQGLPLELKYLPVVESGLDPNAVSKHGASGLWQFMIGTAKGLGLEVNSLVDERRDPYISSERAASYLKDLYAMYGDWSLAIAAYNCGPGAVNKAIRRAGGEVKDHDFWSIYNYLPDETRGYVPMFIAANYVMNYYPEHNISPVLPVKPLVMDTLQISDRVHFNQISKVLDIPVDELRILNPQFRADLIPGGEAASYTLILPSQQIHAYLMSEKEILACDADKYGQRGQVEPGEMPSDAIAAVESTEVWPEDMGEADVALAAAQGKPSVIVHKVASGESIYSIAEKYGVTASEIKKSNNLRRNAVRIGQQLRITTTMPGDAESSVAQNEPVRQQSNSSANRNSKNNSKAQGSKGTQTNKNTVPAGGGTHKIKSGETLSSISKKYGVSVAEIKAANGMKSDALRAGATLKIPAKSAKASSSKSSGSTTKKSGTTTKKTGTSSKKRSSKKRRR